MVDLSNCWSCSSDCQRSYYPRSGSPLMVNGNPTVGGTTLTIRVTCPTVGDITLTVGDASPFSRLVTLVI